VQQLRLGQHRPPACLPPACLVQGDKERELGLPISPLFDRQKPGASKSQIGFFGERLMSCWSLP
jgi:hypothetical protein